MTIKMRLQIFCLNAVALIPLPMWGYRLAYALLNVTPRKTTYPTRQSWFHRHHWVEASGGGLGSVFFARHWYCTGCPATQDEVW